MVNETPIQDYCNKQFKNKHKERLETPIPVWICSWWLKKEKKPWSDCPKTEQKESIYLFRAKTEYIHSKTQLKKINVLTFSFQPLNISNLLNNKYEDTKYSETYYNKNEVIYCHRYKRIKQENNTLCE